MHALLHLPALVPNGFNRVCSRLGRTLRRTSRFRICARVRWQRCGETGVKPLEHPQPRLTVSIFDLRIESLPEAIRQLAEEIEPVAQPRKSIHCQSRFGEPGRDHQIFAPMLQYVVARIDDELPIRSRVAEQVIGIGKHLTPRPPHPRTDFAVDNVMANVFAARFCSGNWLQKDRVHNRSTEMQASTRSQCNPIGFRGCGVQRGGLGPGSRCLRPWRRSSFRGRVLRGRRCGRLPPRRRARRMVPAQAGGAARVRRRGPRGR